jgi:hypothetical protein
MTIECVQNKSAAEFLEKNEEHLLQNESMNNLILGLTDSIARNLRGSDFYYAKRWGGYRSGN